MATTEPEVGGVRGAPRRDLVVAILGLGEAGSSIGDDLIARGVRVKGWDPDPARTLVGARAAESSIDAVAGSDVVLSINSASVALDAAQAATPALRPGQIFADLNSASRELKVAVAAVIADAGAEFVDAALMDGVPGRGLGTRCLVSGSGAAAFVEIFAPLGMPVEKIGEQPGEAATRKLLRSIFAKGLGAVVQESVRAGRAAGCEEWLRAEIAQMLTSADAALVDRLLIGSQRHAVRRLHEMQDVHALMLELGVQPRVTSEAIAYLSEMADGGEPT
jgi:3-hydroxyisobutyrate dehydrogenase-like beta-hydroxyacid dehydrogenase